MHGSPLKTRLDPAWQEKKLKARIAKAERRLSREVNQRVEKRGTVSEAAIKERLEALLNGPS